jgi:hypothetical protein
MTKTSQTGQDPQPGRLRSPARLQIHQDLLDLRERAAQGSAVSAAISSGAASPTAIENVTVWCIIRARTATEVAMRTHLLVIGELACGNLPKREETLAWLQRLPAAPVATDAEALTLIERHRLMSRGTG